MATSMTSAASSFVFTVCPTGSSAQARPTSVSFFYNKPGSSSARRLFVRAEEASSSSPPAPAAEKETAVAEPAKPPPPPPIGPKRGTKVKILRRESYWYNGTGSVVTVDQLTTAKIRSEVLSPFRSVRMFFYLAFIASGALGGLIAITQLISALANPSKQLLLPEILKGLGIDLGAVLLFYFLYARENKAKNVQLAKLFREESLSRLKLRIDQNKIVAVNDLRGIARLVILSGPAAYINESFKLSEVLTEDLLERGVLVVPLATDRRKLEFESEDNKEELPIDEKMKKLWQLRPVNVGEWSNWIDEQKKLATVSLDSPVYLSLRMDGRVRGSGVGYPPWNALVAQLPPVKGLWSGILDGMDGRVL